MEFTNKELEIIIYKITRDKILEKKEEKIIEMIIEKNYQQLFIKFLKQQFLKPHFENLF